MKTEIRKVLVGVDGSDDARHAVEWAVDLAQRFQAEVVAVHAVGLLAHLGQGPPVPAQAHLAELRQAFETEWCEPLAHGGVQNRLLLRDGPPAPVLLQVADEEEADVVIVGRRGAGGFAELLLGSTSQQLAQHCARPLLIVPPDATSG